MREKVESKNVVDYNYAESTAPNNDKIVRYKNQNDDNDPVDDVLRPITTILTWVYFEKRRSPRIHRRMRFSVARLLKKAH